MQHQAVVGGQGGGVMRFEAVVAEARGEQAGGAAPDGVGAASVGGGDEDGALSRRGSNNFFELPGLDERNVSRNHQAAIDAMGLTIAGGDFDGVGFAAIVGVSDHRELKFLCKLKSEWITGDNANFGAMGPSRKSFEHIAQHSLREFGAGGLVENRRKASLGAGEVFNRNQDHDGSEPAWAALSAENNANTWRASSAFSSDVPMIVLAQWTRSPDCRSSSAARASRVSTTRMSRNSRYAWATPAIETGKPWAAIKMPAGPDTADPQTTGLMAATGA